MAKNKKNRQKPQQQQQKLTPKQQIVTQEIYDDGQSALEESGTVLNAVPDTDVNVAEIEAAYTTDGSVTSEDVAKLTADLRKSTKIMNATQKAYETLKETYKNAEKQAKTLIDDATAEASKIKEDAQAEADALTEDAVSKADAVKEELAQKRNELNQRELKLIEDESAAQSGDHSAVIDRLIKAFKNSKEQVIVAAETQLQEQADVANEYIEKLGAITAKESQLEIKEKELKTREKKVKAMEVVIEEEREELRVEIEKKIKDEYDGRLEDAIEESNRYKDKMTKLNEDVNSLKDTLAIIQSAFGEVEPTEMAEVCNKLKAEIENLTEELATRPHQDELDNKQKEVELLTQNLVELRQKFNETEYLELKKMFDNNDALIQDNQLLIDKIESANARIINYQDTIADLRRTISEINESHNKDNAFKASSKYDNGDYQVPMIKGTAPSCLSDFISYLQSYMASPDNGDKELRYSKDTIKKFIAGLHMSPISILQGISGTGKTSLPRAVAMAMTADDVRYSVDNGDDELPQAPYRICPIQSGWRDKMDLMGFYNSFEKSYHETEFFNALYLANQPKYEHTLFFIVLDEMNLSRPEHYFADFLSKLEQSEGQRKIKIDNVPEDICPKSIIGGTLSIPKNVRFIGTANHDETTLEFAPKTYDRSNVIDMPRNCPSGKIPNLEKKYNVTYDWLSKKFKEAEDKHVEECNIFDDFIKDKDLLDLLAERGIGVGNRFEGQAKRFLSVFVEAGENIKEDTAKAADHLMTTRLLRTLKDNYDLGYDTLDDFKERYKLVFFDHFGYEPIEAIELIEKELDKKK